MAKRKQSIESQTMHLLIRKLVKSSETFIFFFPLCYEVCSCATVHLCVLHPSRPRKMSTNGRFNVHTRGGSRLRRAATTRVSRPVLSLFVGKRPISASTALTLACFPASQLLPLNAPTATLSCRTFAQWIKNMEFSKRNFMNKNQDSKRLISKIT